MIKGPDLRSHVNRKLKFGGAGEYQLDVEYRNGIFLPIEEGLRGLIEAGTTVTLSTPTTVRVMDRVLAVQVNPTLYDYGLVGGVPYIEELMGEVQPSVRFEADHDIDLTDIPWLFKLFILG